MYPQKCGFAPNDVCARRRKVVGVFDLKKIASLLHGCSGADIKGVCMEAGGGPGPLRIRGR